MRIAIIGPGALGCFLAASIALKTDHEVILIDHDKERARFLGNGLHLIEDDNEYTCSVATAVLPWTHGEEIDLCLLCVKSHAVPNTLGQLIPMLHQRNVLITFQNGFSHIALIQKMPNVVNAALGVTAQGATLLAPGVVRHAGRGLTKIGMREPLSGGYYMLSGIADILRAAEIPTEVISDIYPHIWAKLFVNVGINALTAIYACPNGDLLSLPTAMNRMARAVEETCAVARARGIPILGDPLSQTIQVCRTTAQNISSMLQDVRKKRLTEVDAINGAIVTMANELGLPAVENEALLREVRELERGFSKDIS